MTSFIVFMAAVACAQQLLMKDFIARPHDLQVSIRNDPINHLLKLDSSGEFKLQDLRLACFGRDDKEKREGVPGHAPSHKIGLPQAGVRVAGTKQTPANSALRLKGFSFDLTCQTVAPRRQR